MMTYSKIPTADLKNEIKKVLDNPHGRGYLPGDGFDKFAAPKLDDLLTQAGFIVLKRETEGPGQFKSVTTSCGIRVFRNGYCHRI